MGDGLGVRRGALAVAVLSTCAASSITAVSAPLHSRSEDAYLAETRVQVSVDQQLQVGYRACDELRAGAVEDDVVTLVWPTSRETSWGMVASAHTNLCPEV